MNLCVCQEQFDLPSLLIELSWAIPPVMQRRTHPQLFKTCLGVKRSRQYYNIEMKVLIVMYFTWDCESARCKCDIIPLHASKRNNGILKLSSTLMKLRHRSHKHQGVIQKCHNWNPIITMCNENGTQMTVIESRTQTRVQEALVSTGLCV